MNYLTHKQSRKFCKLLIEVDEQDFSSSIQRDLDQLFLQLRELFFELKTVAHLFEDFPQKYLNNYSGDFSQTIALFKLFRKNI